MDGSIVRLDRGVAMIIAVVISVVVVVLRESWKIRVGCDFKAFVFRFIFGITIFRIVVRFYDTCSQTMTLGHE